MSKYKPTQEEEAKKKIEDAVDNASRVGNSVSKTITGLVSDLNTFGAGAAQSQLNVSDGPSGGGGGPTHGNGRTPTPPFGDGDLTKENGPSHPPIIPFHLNGGDENDGGIGDGTGSPNMQGGLLNSQTSKVQGGGTYNSMKDIDLTDVNKTVADGATSSLKQSDAYQGYFKLHHYAQMAGVGTLTKHAEQRDIWNGMKIRDKSREEELRQALGEKITHDQTTGKAINMGTAPGSYQVNDGRKGYINGLKVYDDNVRKIDHALEKHGINGKNLNNTEIRKALKTGKMGSKTLTHDEKVMLQEKLRLNNYRNKYRQAQRHDRGVRNTARAWAQETMKDSDAVQGYQVTRIGIQVTRTGVKVARGTAAVGADVAMFAAKNGAILGNNIKGIKASADYKAALKSGNVTDISQKKSALDAVKDNKKKIKENAKEKYQKINNWNSRGTGGVLWDKTVERLGNTKLGKKVTGVRDKVKNFFVKRHEAFLATKRGKAINTVLNGKFGIKNILHAPGKFFSVIGTAKRVLLACVGAILIFCFVLNWIFLAIGRYMTTSATTDVKLGKMTAGVNSSWSPLQNVQNDMQTSISIFEDWAQSETATHMYKKEVPDGTDEDGNPKTKIILVPYEYLGLHWRGAPNSSKPTMNENGAVDEKSDEPMKSEEAYANNCLERGIVTGYDEKVLTRSLMCSAIGFTGEVEEEDETLYYNYIGMVSYDSEDNGSDGDLSNLDTGDGSEDGESQEETAASTGDNGGTGSEGSGKIYFISPTTGTGLIGLVLDSYDRERLLMNYGDACAKWAEMRAADPNDSSAGPQAAITEYIDDEKHTVEFSINMCGLRNMIYLDMHNGKIDGPEKLRITNAEAHAMGSSGAYEAQMPGPNYHKWKGWGKEEDITEHGSQDNRDSAVSLFELYDDDYWAQLEIVDLTAEDPNAVGGGAENAFSGQLTALDHQEFITTILPIIYATMQKRGWQNPDVASRYALAQFALECGWGKSCHNYNLGFLTGNKGHGTFKVGTNPRSFTIYSNYQECVNDYLNRLERKWPGTMTATNLDEYVYALEMSGPVYCGDRMYDQGQYERYRNKINSCLGGVPSATALAEYTGSTTGEGPSTGTQK